MTKILEIRARDALRATITMDGGRAKIETPMRDSEAKIALTRAIGELMQRLAADEMSVDVGDARALWDAAYEDEHRPDPNQETENINHAEMEELLQSGRVVVLRDSLYPMGRFQTVAHMNGAELHINTWHDRGNDGNWHGCTTRGAMLLPPESTPKLAALLESTGVKAVPDTN